MSIQEAFIRNKWLQKFCLVYVVEGVAQSVVSSLQPDPPPRLCNARPQSPPKKVDDEDRVQLYP